MPEFYIKKGLADVDLKTWIEEHKDEPFVRVNIEVESKHDRLRRSFHVLLKEWFNSGEWSCNGAEIHTLEKFKDYYKYVGCDYVAAGYGYNGDVFTDIIDEVTEEIEESALEQLNKIYPDAPPNRIRVIPKSWTKMNKEQKSNALNILLTEIRLSMTNNQKVLEWVAKITKEFI